jgi:hypothetical protein
MACELCQPQENPCRHEQESKIPSVSSMQACQEAKDLVAEMNNLLRLDQLYGVAQKHLLAAYARGLQDAQTAADNREDC